MADETTKPQDDQSTDNADEQATSVVEALADADESEKLDQEVKIEDAGPARKKITITIPEERINQKIDANLNDLQNEAVLPGFLAVGRRCV